MKTNQLKFIATNLALVASLGIFAGCVSHSYDKGAATSAALQSSADKVNDVSAKVNDTLAALNNLTFKSQGDLRDQFDAFSSSLKKLDATRTDLSEQISEVQTKSQAYLAGWSDQMTNIQSEELRQRSSQRKDEVTAKLKTVEDSYQGVQNSFKPFTQDLTDIQTYLGTDLTAGGVASIKDVVAKTKTDAVPLRDSIKQLQVSFSDLSTALSPILPAADAK
jgi:chromosome segregation ATPase